MFNVQCTYMSNIGTTVERFNGQTTTSLTGDKTLISKSTFLSFFPPSVCLSQLAGYTTTTRVFWTSLLSFGERLLAPLLEVGLGICKIVPSMGAFEFYRWARFGLRDHERAVVRRRLRRSNTACPRRGRQAISSAHVCCCPVISYYHIHVCHFELLPTHVTLNMSVLPHKWLSGTTSSTRRFASTTRSTWSSSSRSPGRSSASANSLGLLIHLVARTGPTSRFPYKLLPSRGPMDPQLCLILTLVGPFFPSTILSKTRFEKFKYCLISVGVM